MSKSIADLYSTSHNPRPSDASMINSLTTPVNPANIIVSSSVPRMEGSLQGAPGPLAFAGSSPASSIPAFVAQTALVAQDDAERQDYSRLRNGALRQPTFIQRLQRALFRGHPLWRLQKSSSTLETFVSDEDTPTIGDFIKTIPTKFYLMLLLFLPSLYFARVGRLFEEAELAMPEIEQMAIRTSSQALNFFDEQTTNGKEVFPRQWIRLQSTWEHFVGSLLREWKTLNVVSALLLSAILTILQIDSAANDYLTRYTALLSLICSLVSLLFGCIFIIRFGTMRKTYIAAEWAMEASQESNTSTWWNVFILLALPAVWLTWSILLYIACIMSFIWRTAPNSQNEPQVLSDLTIVKIRVGISIVLGLAVVYSCFIVATFRKYGSAMDLKWTDRIRKWRLNKAYNSAYPFYDSPNGSVGSPTAVMTPLRGESPVHSSPAKPSVHFRDDVSFISTEIDSPPAHSPLSVSQPAQEVVNPTSNYKDAHNFILGSYGDHQAVPDKTHQESMPVSPESPQRPYGMVSSHTAEAEPPEMWLPIPIQTRGPPIPPAQPRPARSSKLHPSANRESLTASGSARSVRFQPLQEDPPEVAPFIPLSPLYEIGMEKSISQAQEARSNESSSGD